MRSLDDKLYKIAMKMPLLVVLVIFTVGIICYCSRIFGDP